MTLYIPKHFNVEDRDALVAFIEHNAFATLVSTGPPGLHVSHVPLLADRDASGKLFLLGHVARNNPHWEALESAADVLAIFHGPHAYVSPSWYQAQPSVPTWNYAVVHAHGTARLLDEGELHDVVIRLSDTFESGRPKPWRAVDLPGDYASNDAQGDRRLRDRGDEARGQVQALPEPPRRDSACDRRTRGRW